MTTLPTRRPAAGALVALAAALAAAPPAVAQTSGSESLTAVVAGYGTATYGGTFADTYAHDFNATVSPIFLFGAGQDVLFEAEFEFGLEGSQTTTALEYAQIDYLGLERFQFTLGKFLLPFGVFGERLHPSWINKLPTMPSLYGHAHGGVAEGALLPILSDLGLMGRANLGLGSRTHLDLSFYVTQGPMIVEEGSGLLDGEGDGHTDHAHSVATASMVAGGADAGAAASAAVAEFDIPTVAFGVTTADNNQNKMLGARLGLVTAPGFEIYLSGFHAMYDPGDFMDYTGGNVTVEWRRGPLEIRSEAVVLRQEFQNDDVFSTLQQTGYYLQAARRFGELEPVLRWSQLHDGTVDDAVARPGRKELSFGFNYWVSHSVPLKVAYSVVPDFDDRVFVQWAFGF